MIRCLRGLFRGLIMCNSTAFFVFFSLSFLFGEALRTLLTSWGPRLLLLLPASVEKPNSGGWSPFIVE